MIQINLVHFMVLVCVFMFAVVMGFVIGNSSPPRDSHSMTQQLGKDGCR